MAELKKFLNEGWVLATLLLVCFGAGVFGAVNWNDFVYPDVPEREVDPYRGIIDPQETYDLRVAEYQRKVDEVGKLAIIPFPLAATLCLTGFFGVAVVLFVLITRAHRGEYDQPASKVEPLNLPESIPVEFGTT
jgi:hypothetical protein